MSSEEGPTTQLPLDGVQLSWAAGANGKGGCFPTAAVHVQHGPRAWQLKQSHQKQVETLGSGFNGNMTTVFHH